MAAWATGVGHDQTRKKSAGVPTAERARCAGNPVPRRAVK